MKRPYRIAAQIAFLCMSLLVSAHCATAIPDILRNAVCNPGRPGFHITAFVGWMLWLPLPVVIFTAFLRRRLAGLFLLTQSLYLGIFFLFWDLVLPTHFVIGNGWLSIMTAVSLLGVLASFYAIRTSRPPARRSFLSPHLRLMTFTCIAMISIFMFHWLSAGEEMRESSTCYVARCRAARGDIPGAIRAYDSLLKRYPHATPKPRLIDNLLKRHPRPTPTRWRVDALVTRAQFKHQLGDKEGVEQDRAELKDLVTRDKASADRLDEWLDDPESSCTF